MLIAIGAASAICLALPPNISSDDDFDQTLLDGDHSSFVGGIDSDSHVLPRPVRNPVARVRHRRTGSDPITVRGTWRFPASDRVMNFTSEVHPVRVLSELSRLWHRGPPSSRLF